MNYESIGNEIKNSRINAGFTQEQLAEKINISAVHLSNIERGKTKMSLDIIVNIATILQTPIDILLYSETELPECKTVINNKINEILEDCSPCEIIALYDIIKAVKDTIRKNLSDKN